jgi:hypothetical protein
VLATGQSNKLRRSSVATDALRSFNLPSPSESSPLMSLPGRRRFMLIWVHHHPAHPRHQYQVSDARAVTTVTFMAFSTSPYTPHQRLVRTASSATQCYHYRDGSTISRFLESALLLEIRRTLTITPRITVILHLASPLMTPLLFKNQKQSA